MLIVGGTYLECCVRPKRRDVFGSALRAAAVVARTGRTRVVTCVDDELLPDAMSVATGLNVELEVTKRDEPIRFSYYTPLTTPSLDGDGQPRKNLSVAGGRAGAIVFGMVEADSEVSAETIVFDPQRPRGPMPIDRGRLQAERFGVVCNSAEVMSLGKSADIREAAKAVLKTASADVVVVKRGPLGALVVLPNGDALQIGPYKTASVWPIGSGDVFTAAFAWAWIDDGREPKDAAELASAATAIWCGRQSLDFPLRPGVDPSALGVGTRLQPRDSPVSVYLAAPFFNIGEHWLVTTVRQALSQNGATVFSPLHDVGPGGMRWRARTSRG